MKQIHQGENALLRRNLLKVDGTALLLADTSSITADIVQSGQTIETLQYPSSKLRQGASDSQIELELTTDVSAKLKKGRVIIRWTITAGNALFSHEGIQKDIINEEALTVI